MICWFDRNRQARKLLSWVSIPIFTPATFKTNLLAPPPGVPWDFWAAVFFQIVQNTLDIRIATRSTIMSALRRLDQTFRFSEGSGHWPNLMQLCEALRNTPQKRWSKESQHLQTAINRFEAVIDILGRPMLDCSRGFSDEVLFCDLDWALELEGPSDVVSFFVSVMVARLYYYRLKKNLFTHKLANLVVVDEAGEIFNVEREVQQDAVEYVISQTVLPRARALGIGFVANSQEFSSLSRGLRTNAGVQVLVGGALGRGEDTDAFARSNGLTREQLRQIKEI